MIVGICGKKGSGKTTAANIFIKNGYKSLAFADPLKNTTSLVFDMPLSILNDPIAKDNMQVSINLSTELLKAFMEELHRTYAPISPETISAAIRAFNVPSLISSPRQLLQVLGTDLIRNHVDEQYWIKAMESKIVSGNKYVIHDVRFENEANLIRNKLKGKLLVISRPVVGSEDSHVSETYKPLEYDYLTANTGSLGQFSKDVANVVRLIEYQDGQEKSQP